MRIAIIAPPWVAVPPPAYGGTEAVLDTLARGLDEAGHDVLLYATGDSTCPVSTLWTLPEAAGTHNTTAAIELRHVVSAYEAVLEWGPDIVHDHTLVGPVHASRFDVSVVTTNHGPFDDVLGPLYRAVCDRVPVIAISNHQASLARDTRVATVIHHGIDVDDFPLGLGEGGYALFLGRMSPDKGVHVAIEVARAAEIPLRIAAKLAEPAEREYFEAVVEPMLGGDIEYVGEVGGQAKRELLASATCLLNPVAWPEPFGMVMIESLACGTPVVATPHGAVPEIVDDAVTGFVRATPAELADAVRHIGVIDRAACRKAASERFSRDRMVHDHLAFYGGIVHDARGPVRVA